MKIFMNKTAVFLQLKSEITYRNNESNELTMPLGYFGDVKHDEVC